MDFELSFPKCIGVPVLATIGLIFLPPLTGFDDEKWGLLGQFASTLRELYPPVGRFILQLLFVMFFVFPVVLVFFMVLSLLISVILSRYDRACRKSVARSMGEKQDGV
ncbi:hypothetical protein BO78DRAFT_472123 [Aspergillus sclerotiicarbonarius CBS 121057]|uniref:Uncharacterized protein n=1 Tax=Aspergillus sclerotiicarbonarius (strain CBS 121057 / IBT 28362) TaxID=1448318 RepID=A0A319DZK2_ASPSB|nr:hypothetical protein BO78DRAFT_472123 [Aspergillus sclerotiicarbonarius CBS 121057]